MCIIFCDYWKEHLVSSRKMAWVKQHDTLQYIQILWLEYIVRRLILFHVCFFNNLKLTKAPVTVFKGKDAHLSFLTAEAMVSTWDDELSGLPWWESSGALAEPWAVSETFAPRNSSPRTEWMRSFKYL